MRISRKIILHGTFWLPSSDRKVNGTLTILDGGKIRLRLENLLYQLEDNNPLIKIIHGRVGEKEITLIDSYCRIYNDLISMISGGHGFEMHVHEVILGKIFPSEEIPIQRLVFSLEGVDDWINGINSLKTSNKINIGKDYILLLQKKSMGVAFKLTSETPQLLSGYRKIIRTIILFFYFILNKPVNLKKVIIESDGENKLPVYYQSTPFSLKKNTSKSDFIQPTDINNLPDTMEKWFEFYISYYPVVHLYFTFLTNSHSFAETKFISLSQALEAYHRLGDYNQQALEKEDFEELKINALASCSTEAQKRWLERQFTYLNKISLRKRLKELINPIKKYYGNCSTRDELINNIVDTRNQLTHITIDNMEKVYAQNNMTELCLKMDTILCFLVLIKLGFNENMISKFATYDRIDFYLNWKQ